jgi:hypothetical protein
MNCGGDLPGLRIETWGAQIGGRKGEWAISSK